jgi:hypothetical protein
MLNCSRLETVPLSLIGRSSIAADWINMGLQSMIRDPALSQYISPTAAGLGAGDLC